MGVLHLRKVFVMAAKSEKHVNRRTPQFLINNYKLTFWDSLRGIFKRIHNLMGYNSHSQKCCWKSPNYSPHLTCFTGSRYQKTSCNLASYSWMCSKTVANYFTDCFLFIFILQIVLMLIPSQVKKKELFMYLSSSQYLIVWCGIVMKNIHLLELH